MKSVLAATDFSEAADEALRQGAQWAREIDAHLFACHVMAGELRSHVLFPQLQQESALGAAELRQRVQEEMAARVTRLGGLGPDDFDVLLEEGTPHEAIVRAAERLGAELIAVGSHGSGGLRRALLGSQADRVMRHARCPVLVARRCAPSARVLAATDLSETARPALAAAAAVARRRGAELVLLHSIDVVSTLPPASDGPIGVFGEGLPAETLAELERAAEQQIALILAELDTRGQAVVTHGAPAGAILRAAATLVADLIVVGTHGRTGLGRLVLGSVAEKVAHEAECPVLVYPLARD